MSRACLVHLTRRAAARAALVTALVTALVAPAAGAQTLAERAAQGGDATVRFRYPVRPGVCGAGEDRLTMRSASGTSTYGYHGRDGWSDRCEPGPAHVAVTVRDGVPRALRLAVGADAPAGGADDGARARTVDLGPVPPAEAAAYLLDLVRRTDARSASRALLAAVVADGALPWRPLLALARDAQLPTATRREAMRWTGHAACEAVTAAHGAPTPADTADRAVRREVVFALSQGRGDERREALLRAARGDRDPAVRCAALFWLSQQGGREDPDARTLDLYEATLRTR